MRQRGKRRGAAVEGVGAGGLRRGQRARGGRQRRRGARGRLALLWPAQRSRVKRHDAHASSTGAATSPDENGEGVVRGVRGAVARQPRGGRGRWRGAHAQERVERLRLEAAALVDGAAAGVAPCACGR